VATYRSPADAVVPIAIADITVTNAREDLLLVEPLDLGPGTPATAALELERGPQPTVVPDRGTK
jgi:hypothetical protein